MPVLLPIKNQEKYIRLFSITTLWFLAFWGAVMVVAQVRPFWIDEWRLIYNIKFKSTAELWGPLDYTQQFPRVYLQLVKRFCAAFEYSYFTLRFPAFLAGITTILYSYRMMNKLFDKNKYVVNRFLFVFMIVSSHTFTFYFVQTKQYTMDILLSLFALAQMMDLLELGKTGSLKTWKYVLLCLSLIICPFFSYTYSIALAPVYAVVLWQGIMQYRERGSNYFRVLLLQWVPLIMGLVSIGIFYKIDVSQLMTDKGMHDYWSHRMLANQFNVVFVLQKLWELFATAGSGFIFEVLFGVVGIIAFIYAMVLQLQKLKKGAREYTMDDNMRLYGIVLFCLVTLLFFSGKLPLGEPRLTVFTLPAVAILIIGLLEKLMHEVRVAKYVKIVSVLLFIGVVGHVYTATIKTFTGNYYAKRMNIYQATENAIIMAQEMKLPMVITPGVAFPDEITKDIPFLEPITGNCILKTFPAYRVKDNISVYVINDLASAEEYIKKLPPEISKLVVGDGITYKIVNR